MLWLCVFFSLILRVSRRIDRLRREVAAQIEQQQRFDTDARLTDIIATQHVAGWSSVALCSDSEDVATAAAQERALDDRSNDDDEPVTDYHSDQNVDQLTKDVLRSLSTSAKAQFE